MLQKCHSGQVLSAREYLSLVQSLVAGSSLLSSMSHVARHLGPVSLFLLTMTTTLHSFLMTAVIGQC